MADISSPPSPLMKALGQSEAQHIFNQLMPMTHPGTVILLSARLEKPLEWLIQARMPGLSNRMKPRMFEGFGPLASFSAKIDIARALDFISLQEAQMLHAVRDIRNAFAHSDAELHFDSPELAPLFAKLPRSAKEKPSEAFLETVKDCSGRLQKRLDQAYLVNAILRQKPEPAPSRPKSSEPSPRKKPRARGGT